MNKYVADARTVDGSGISSFDTLEEAKGVWCFWLSVYELNEESWSNIKENYSTYADVSKHLKETYRPVYVND